MEEDDIRDRRLVALVEQVFAFGKPQAIMEVIALPKPETNNVPIIEVPAQMQSLAKAPKLQPERKTSKTAAELASMIELDLAQHPDCPEDGFRITVYGATDWRAMLTITPAAGRVQDPQRWRNLTHELAERLRQRYDLAWE